ncbi:MAG: stage II sporulation protein R [Oscillospiraceae bacterium]|nr:stage II sporulation protein R [Oscillospiraceae bacterium]
MNKIIAAFAIALGITVIASSYSDSVQADLRDNLIRLHIIAESDSEADQNIKLKVRDAVLKEVREKFDIEDEKCMEEIIHRLPEFEETANRVLRENGFDYTARAMYGKFPFPEKTYKSMTLPAGDYYGIRIILGNGQGHNWWCVMYPPLCMSEDGEMTLSEESKKILRETLDKDTYDIITKKNNEVVVKFKIIEIVQEIKQKIK